MEAFSVLVIAAALGIAWFIYSIWKSQTSSPMEWHPARRLAREQYRRPQSFYDRAGVNATEGYYTNSGGKELLYRRWMPTSGKVKGVVFMCHGYGGMCWFFGEDVAVRLASAGYLTFGIDYENHGCSEGLHGYIPRFDALAEDVVAFCDQLRAVPVLRDLPLFLYGLSMGGAVVIKSHWMRPQGFQGAILNAPMVKIADEVMPPKPLIAAGRLLQLLAPKVKMVPSKNITKVICRDPKVREEVGKNVVIYQQRPRVATAFSLLDTSIEICANMEQVTLPILILHGKEDIVTDPKSSEELHRRAKSEDKTLRMYDAWHALMAGESEELIESVYTDILKWLDERSTHTTVDLSGVPDISILPPFKVSA